jgi:hypothetical protein
MAVCESCGEAAETKQRSYYAEDHCEPTGLANVCDECYYWTPSERMAANVLIRLGLPLTQHLKEELEQ